MCGWKDVAENFYPLFMSRNTWIKDLLFFVFLFLFLLLMNKDVVYGLLCMPFILIVFIIFFFFSRNFCVGLPPSQTCWSWTTSQCLETSPSGRVSVSRWVATWLTDASSFSLKSLFSPVELDVAYHWYIKGRMLLNICEIIIISSDLGGADAKEPMLSFEISRERRNIFLWYKNLLKF